MTLFSLQVACGCNPEGPIGMEPGQHWDGECMDGGFVGGRRYVWTCPDCGNTICINMEEYDGEEE